MASQLLGGSDGESESELKRRFETKTMAETDPSSKEGQEGLHGDNTRVGSVRRMWARLRFFSGSAGSCAFADVSPFAPVFDLLDEPLTLVPFAFPRVFGAMLSSVPEVTSRALPLVEGVSETGWLRHQSREKGGASRVCSPTRRRIRVRPRTQTSISCPMNATRTCERNVPSTWAAWSS